jgi:amino acid transporter
MATQTEERGGAQPGGKLQRDVSTVGLLFFSLGSIIGSGWLFGSLYAAQVAGPAAIISWVGGGLVMIILALVHAELGAMYPVAGGSARYPHFAFGSLAGFSIGWIVWVGSVTVAPIEVLAVTTYLVQWFPWMMISQGGTEVLTGLGIVFSVALMGVFTIINLLGVGSLAKSNNVIMIWKVAVPFLAVIVLLIAAFNGSNFTSEQGGFAPFGITGILSALGVGGIVFAYQGFEQAIQLGGETRNPGRNIPLAVIGSMIIGVILYIGLQFAFIGAIHPSELKDGWAVISFPQDAGPFAGIATAVGVGWLATIVYIDAMVSPGGTGLIYIGASSRLSFALGRNHYIPHQAGYLTQGGVPIVSIIASFIIGCIAFLPFPAWSALVNFIVSATVMGYATVPLALGAMRRQEPDHPRPFKLPAGEVIAVAAFVIANLIIYWSGWDVLWRLYIAIAVGYVLLGIGHIVNPSEFLPRLDWRGGSWLWPYFIGLAILSYLSPTDFGGTGLLPFGIDIILVAAFSIAIYYYAMSVRLTPEEVRSHVADARAESEEEEELAV